PLPDTPGSELQRVRDLFQISPDDKVTLDNGETVPIEFILHILLASCMEQGTKHLQLIKELLEKERRALQVKENRRTEQMQKVVQEAGSLKTISKAEKIGTAMTFVVSGLDAAINNGNIALGLPTALAGLLLAADLFFDDAGKKKIASWLSLGDKNSEASWLQRLDFATSIFSLATSFGLSG